MQSCRQGCVRLRSALICIEMHLGGYNYIIRSAQYELLVMLFPSHYATHIALGIKVRISCS